MDKEQHHVLEKKKNDMVAFSEEHCRCPKRQRKKDSSYDIVAMTSVSIPDDILFEILVLLPVKCLLRCKSVCKSWLAIISDPRFVAAHLDRARRSPKLAILPLVNFVDWDVTVYSYEEGTRHADFLFMKEFNDLQERLAAPQHSNGLFLLETPADLCVCNPSTRQAITLPRDEHFLIFTREYDIVERAGFGFDSDSGVYKVARYFNRCSEDDKIDLGFRIFTLGVDSSWRVTVDPPCQIATYRSPVSAGGAIYYMIRKKIATPESLLLCFDIRDEAFTIVPSPPLLSTIKNTQFYMAEVEDVLFLCTSEVRNKNKNKNKMSMWKLSKDCNGHTWTRSFRIDLSQTSVYFRPLAIRQGKLLLQIGNNKKKAALAYYDLSTRSLEKTVDLGHNFVYYNRNRGPIPRYFREEDSLFQVVSYVESLVSWDTTRRRNRSSA